MLLVDDHQAQIVEFDFVLDERMGADGKLRIALRNMPTHIAFAILLQRPGQ